MRHSLLYKLQKDEMGNLAVFCIFWAAFTGLTAGSGVLPDGPLTAAVGGSVTFNTTVAATPMPFPTVIWTFIEGSNEIPVITATSQNKTGPGYQGRITLFKRTGSLELSKLALSDSGKYSLVILTESGDQITGSTTLQTLEPVSNVMLTVNSTDLLEFNSTLRLSCSSLGSSVSFHWLNDSAEISADDRVQFTDEGAALTIAPVTRYDQRSFRCRVSNAVSEDDSHSVHLSVSYGPDDTHLVMSPRKEYVAEGSNVNLSCSANSRPVATFTWFVNGKLLVRGSNFSLVNVQQHHSGNYSCQSFNTKTLRYKESQKWPIHVLKKISGASVTLSTSRPVEGTELNMTCDAAGSVFFREWTKGGSALIPDERVTLHDKNRTVSFRTAVRSDSASYSCRIINPIDEEEVTLGVLVNYGPDPVQITGPSQIIVKETLTLSCSAVSVPAATYMWTALNSTAVLHNSSTFVKYNVNFSDSGSYVCSATNGITGKSMSASHRLDVTDGTDTACSAGCIAGIVLACLVICAAVAGGAYAFYIQRNKTKNRPDRDISNRTGLKFLAGGIGQDNTEEPRNQELNYADVTILHAKGGGKGQLELQASQTEYAEVRVNNAPPSYDAYVRRMKRRAPQPLEARPQVHSNESCHESGEHSTV
ncbi:carcinoembryonic antigen-related cell adhesion molecule 20-like isoform X1 [Syngnathus acus]|uniref:carcinoembryonic antigen-related cell adhesion molecule 20-like isoform X1 n=1 Tax=Syngnathus acus TaxID=161584 RepID=UPI001885CABA|nr:carcinoembryonic antigen-related cell adhesion molecule 20-like isoform X1 [Syngnathus acus]